MGLKMAKKMLQISGNSDQTCVSMGFIKGDLKGDILGPHGFIKLPKIFEKFSKLADFRPKIVPFFLTEIYRMSHTNFSVFV